MLSLFRELVALPHLFLAPFGATLQFRQKIKVGKVA
jgi:hypothetical protein